MHNMDMEVIMDMAMEDMVCMDMQDILVFILMEDMIQSQVPIFQLQFLVALSNILMELWFLKTNQLL